MMKENSTEKKNSGEARSRGVDDWFEGLLEQPHDNEELRRKLFIFYAGYVHQK